METPEATSVLTWVPQLFYDLIGRVVPGAAVSASYFLLLRDSAEVKSLVSFLLTESGGLSLPVLLLIGLLLSYLVGVLLGAIGFLVQSSEWKTETITLSIHEPPNLETQALLRSFMYDAVQLYNPQVGARLAKLSAEQHMCRVLMVGFIGLVPTRLALQTQHILGTGPGTLCATIILSFVALVVVFSSALFHRHLDIRSTRQLANYWYSLDLAKKTRLAGLRSKASSSAYLTKTITPT